MQRKPLTLPIHSVPSHVKPDLAKVKEISERLESKITGKPTLQQKYDWLCAQLEITDTDFWENDATIRLKNSYPESKTCGDACRSLYFQFSHEEYPETVDEAVVLAMRSEMKC